MLSDEPLHAALTDAVPLGQLPLGRTRSEGCDEPFRVRLREPVSDTPLAGSLGRTHAEHGFTTLSLCLPQLPHRADQGVC
jgi:hypothetical protein